ncbi:MAG: hypothetical protein HKO87_01485, partial [Acidimicrobiia bacterium]|nr:hypothetical protein [Acidimicrobiia bacterium]
EEAEVGVDVTDGPAEIIKITPIALDCRARVVAEVPVVGTHRTQVVGQTVSTDTVRMRAVGDVDTCVEAAGVDINERADGSIGVIIDAESIVFRRPRVDAIATMESVETDRGFVGQLVDVLPWTNEDDELTPAAFAFAQNVIGGSECMQAAYSQTQAAIESAYARQLVEQGGDPDDIEVIISGIPDFGQNELDERVLGDFEFAEEAGTTCVIATG